MKKEIVIHLDEDEIIEACKDYCLRNMGSIYVSTESIDLSHDKATKDADKETYVAYMSVNVDFGA